VGYRDNPMGKYLQTQICGGEKLFPWLC